MKLFKKQALGIAGLLFKMLDCCLLFVGTPANEPILPVSEHWRNTAT